ncbi:efflux RND transporter periplasmic adaptor subunit [Paractinoplanes rishiriensis]|uniref:Macrolide transporter n=1 Tax=Paractinoplanes rishiriensis TaxID=1050105 RepID=A0A919MWR7_9ACTN|nr:efflux RND transporter periplasmic adaptor subunit [Actinoplanes rishiriensis]GIE94955.1 macrolide transporter [Actinoplanes rishiriensis]
MPVRVNLRRPSVAVNAALVAALVAGVFWAYETLSGPETTRAADSSVRAVLVQQGEVRKTVTATGSVASASTASASFGTGGTVTAINVRVGQAVKKGQVLAKVDPAAAQRALDAAEANRDAAADSLTRAEAAGSDTSTAENEVTKAQLAVNEAEAALAGTTLKAPMAGTVVAVNGTLGSSSGAGGNQGGGSESTETSAGFVDIADLSRMQVTASFAEADATKLKEKQVATVTWNALAGTAAPAEVVAVDPSATTANNVVTYGVTLTLDNVPAGAKVGQTVSVSVVTGSVAGATYVNAAAITTVGDRHTVTVVANGVQETRAVEVGLVGDQATQITSGVQAGEQVVVKATTGTSGGGEREEGPGGGFGGLNGGGGGPPGGFRGGGGGR